MASTVTRFGEFIETKINQAKGQGYAFLVAKYIDGKFHSNTPAKSMGEARRIENSILT